CKAQRFRYKHNDMADLEAQLRAAKDARFRLIATDGCFSMDGTIADLKSIVELAEKYDALTMMDDAHATGFLGKTGRGTHEYRGVMGRIDIITGTLGKALGGASGGFTSGRREIVGLLRQRSRPYLFSNTIAPPVVAASLKALELLSASTELRDKLEENTKFFPAGLTERGLTIKPGLHPIVPNAIRQDFPILGEQAHGHPLIYFDSAASSQKPRAVIEALRSFYEHDNANVHRGLHTLSSRATEAYERARQRVADYVGAASAKEIIFTRGTTESIN